MRLHLGCGRKKWPGYVNMDLKDSDHDCDIRCLPFDDGTAEEIVAIHVVEHFMLTEIANIIVEWHRVLTVGGKLIVELPCWDKVQEHVKNTSSDNMTRWALYGEPATHRDGIEAVHKWCYSKYEMKRLLEHVGFTDVSEETPRYHQPTRDMRWVATKCK